MNTTLFTRLTIIAALFMLINACSTDSASSVQEEGLIDSPLTESFKFNHETNTTVLSSRVIKRNESFGAKIKSGSTFIQDTAGVVVESQMLPPNHPGIGEVITDDVLSATHITKRDNKYYVTYHSNEAGNLEGGVQILTVNGDREFSIAEEATSNLFEWNHAYSQRNTIWIAGNANRGAALFGIPTNDDGSINTIDTATVYNLHGRTANATHKIGGVTYVSIGSTNANTVLSDGRGQAGVYALQTRNIANSVTAPKIAAYSNLKYLAEHDGDLIALRYDNSNNAQLIRFSGNPNNFNNLDLSVTTTYQINVAIAPTDGKNTMFIRGNIAYIAAGTNGLISYDISGAGSLVDQIDFNGNNKYGNQELGSSVNAVWGDNQNLYISAGSAFVIIPIDDNGNILKEDAIRIPLSHLVGDFNNDGVTNVDDITASKASVNHAYRINANSNVARVLVAIGRAGVVYLNIDLRD